ncbi:MAG: carboxypeptidase regulatory-like domain-containing protein [Acidobacteriota bacterium]
MKSASRLGLTSFLCLLLTAFSTVAMAQEYRGIVQGLVTDSSGAVVPGADVILKNDNTGIEDYKVSNAQGRYYFGHVEPGAYTLTVTLPGFKTFVQENIQMQVRADVTVNAVLSIGEVSETVIVTTAPVAVQFNTSTMDLTVDRKMLTELPVVARNPFTLALLDAAVVNRYGGGMMGSRHARNPFFMWSSSSIDVGGSTNRKNDLQLDGAPLQLGPRAGYAPPMDAVQEFTVQQNSVDAEYGHSAGGILNLAMKSGTNEYHGTAYYFGRNPGLNAVSDAVVRSPNEVRNHIWGGTLGNPIIEDKLFTFTSYEQWRTKAPYSTTMTLPTELERNGDFSQSLNAAGELSKIYDPWSTRFDPETGQVTRAQFPNNIIPANRIDPVAARIMQDIWLPNGPGDDVTGVNNYKKGYFWWLNYWNISNRTDWNINDKWKMFGRFSRFRTSLAQPNYTPNNSIAMRDDNAGAMHALNIAGDTVYTVNPTTVLNFRMSYNSAVDDYDAPNSKIGEEGLAGIWGSNDWYKPYLEDIPAIYYPGISVSGNGSAGFGKPAYWFRHPESWNYAGRVSKTVGRHNMKTGLETRFYRGNAATPRLMSFRFEPALTADTFISPDTKLSGDGWATFLLGALDDDSIAQTLPRQRPMLDYYALFFHDDFKLSQRLTLNMGLRWEYQTAPADTQGRLSRFLDLSDPIPEMQSNPPEIPEEVTALMDRPYIFNGAWVFTDDQHERMFNTSKDNFMPRLGLAYRLDDKTAIRIGYARYVIIPGMQTDIEGSTQYPGFSAATRVAPALEGVPAARLNDPFPASNPLILPSGKSLGRYTNLGGEARWDRQDFVNGVNDRINFSIQRQLAGDLHVDVTYFVNLGHDLPYAKDLNLINPELYYQHKSALDKRIPNPFFHYLTPELFPGQLRNQKTIRVADLLKPYPQYGRLREFNTPGAKNRYQAFQLMVKKSFNQGYQLHLAYNYNREKTSGFYDGLDLFNDHLTYIDSRNPRHRIAAAGTYELPFGRGRRFLSGSNPIINGIFGGWSTSALFFFRSGRFLRFGAMEVNGDPSLVNPTKDRWFDTSVFEKLPAYTRRSNPLQFDDLAGPKEWNLDLTLAKHFPINENIRLEFRLEAYNVTNSFMPSDPSTNVFSSLFGKSTRQENRGREVQYTARIHF